MTPSLWSVLVIFVLAPLGVVLLITAVVFLLVSPSRRPAPKPIDELQDQGSDRDGESDADMDELQDQGSDRDGESDADIEGDGDPR